MPPTNEAADLLRAHRALAVLDLGDDARLLKAEAIGRGEDIAAAIIGHLKAALDEIEILAEELEPEAIEGNTTALEVGR